MPGEDAPSPRRWDLRLASTGLALPLLVIVVNFALGVLTNRVTLRDFPTSGDEHAYLVSARIFAEGRLSVPSPELPRFFDCVHVVNDGRYYGKYPPGWPLLLAAGVVVGLPWMVNLLLGAAALLATHAIARRIFSPEVANLSSILALGNPFLIFHSASYFSHMACLLAVTLFVGATLIAPREPDARRWPLLAGAAIGLAFLIRPYTTLWVALPVLIYGGVRFVRSRGWKGLGRQIALGAGPAILVLALNLGYNACQTGSPFLPPFLHYWSKDLPGLASADFSRRVAQNLVQRFLELAPWMPLAPVFLLLHPILRATRANRDGLLLCAIPAALLAGHFLYYGDGGYQYGPRYLFEAATALLVVGALVIASFGRAGVPLLVAAVLMNAVFLGVVSRAEYRESRRRAEMFDLVAERRLSDAIVFVKSRSGPRPAKDLIRNGIHFDGPVLYALDMGDENPKLLAAHPTRSAWLYDIDPAKGTGRLTPWEGSR